MALALAEVIVSAGVLLIMLSLVTLALTAYLRGTHQLFRQPFPAHEMARGLERSNRLARSAQAVLWPPRAELQDYRPAMPDRAPLVLLIRASGATQVVGLACDPKRQRLLEVVYTGSFEPGQPYPPDARTVDLGPASGLSIRLEGEQLRFTLSAGDQQLPWTSALILPGVRVP